MCEGRGMGEENGIHFFGDCNFGNLYKSKLIWKLLFGTVCLSVVSICVVVVASAADVDSTPLEYDDKWINLWYWTKIK